MRGEGARGRYKRVDPCETGLHPVSRYIASFVRAMGGSLSAAATKAGLDVAKRCPTSLDSSYPAAAMLLPTSSRRCSGTSAFSMSHAMSGVGFGPEASGEAASSTGFLGEPSALKLLTSLVAEHRMFDTMSPGTCLRSSMWATAMSVALGVDPPGSPPPVRRQLLEQGREQRLQQRQQLLEIHDVGRVFRLRESHRREQLRQEDDLAEVCAIGTCIGSTCRLGGTGVPTRSSGRCAILGGDREHLRGATGGGGGRAGGAV